MRPTCQPSIVRRGAGVLAPASIVVSVVFGLGNLLACGDGPVELRLSDPDCDPARKACTCEGTVPASAGLATIGRSAEGLRSGVPCVPGDFDGNGTTDYAIPGTGYDCIRPVDVRVLFTRRGGGLARAVDLGPIACIHLYLAREEVGEFGEPVSDRDGLVQWGEGGDTDVYLWDEDRFVRRSYASDREATSFEERAIGWAMSRPASRLLDALPADRRFGDWLDDVCGTGCDWTVELNDCGEATGDPARDAGRSIPACVDVTGRRPTGLAFAVSVVVGVFDRRSDGGVDGRLADTPSVRFVHLDCGDGVRRLADLAELGELLESGVDRSVACEG